MSAPALILLAHGSTLPVVSEVIRKMRAHMQSVHPNIPVHIAFADHEHPTAQRVLSRLERSGVREAILVPLNLANLFNTSTRLDEIMTAAQARCPKMTLSLARPVGPETGLLNLIDLRLRQELACARVGELDGLVLATEPSRDKRSRSILARRARQWSLHHRLPALVASDSVGAAITQLRAEGRRHIAVGSMFLTAHGTYAQCRADAIGAGAIAVAKPIGFAPEVCDMAFGRYSVAAMDLLRFGPDEASDGEDVPETSASAQLHVVGA